MTTPDDPRFEALRRKLVSFSLPSIQEGLAELAEINDPALFDRFLEGDKEQQSLVIPDGFEHVFYDVLSLAPEGSARATERRAQVTRIYLHARIEGIVVDLERWLARLPNVTWINMSRVRISRAAPVARLESFDLGTVSFDEPAGLAALASSPALRFVTLWTLDLAGAPLTDLEPLRGASGLQGINVRNDTLRDVRALAATMELRWAVFAGCKALGDISAFEGHPNLRVVHLHDTQVDKEALPKGLRRICTWAVRPNIGKLAGGEPQKPPPPKQKLARTARATLDQVKKLFKSEDPAILDEGLALLASLGDPAAYTELLGDAYHNEGQQRIVTSGFKGPTGLYTLLGLVATAPPSCAIAAGIRGATGLRLEGPEKGSEKARPLDLLHLEAFSKLATLHIERLGPFVPRDRPACLPDLTSLFLTEVDGDIDLALCAGSPALRRLDLRGLPGLDSVRPLLGHAALEDLNLSGLPRLQSLRGIARMPRLKSLTVRHCRNLDDLGDLGDLPLLESLQLDSTWVTDLAPLRALPALDYLRVENHDLLQSLGGVSGHPRLRRLSVLGCGVRSLDDLTDLPALLDVYLYQPGPLTSVDPFARFPLMRSLTLDGLPKLRSVDALASLPLVYLQLKRTGVKQVPAAIAGCAKFE